MKSNDNHPFYKLGQKAVFRIGAVGTNQFITDGLPQIAFAGRSNVGKSSLQNALMGRHGLVRTSCTPGRTREINFFEIPDKGWLVDLPGFGYARGGNQSSGMFAKLVGDYLSQDGQPALVVYILDADVPDSDVDDTCLGRILDAGVPCLILMNKADKLDQSKRTRYPAMIRDRFKLETIPPLISARTGKGLDAIRDRILSIFEPLVAVEPEIV